MAIHRLKPRFVDTVTRAGMYSDGGGLYLQVGEGGGAKSWIFRYNRSRLGKPGEAHMGLGPTHTVSLDEARELARECRKQLFQGTDPIETRKAERLAKQLKESKDVTFAFCAADYLAFKQRIWAPGTNKNANHAVRTYLLPALGDLPIAAVDYFQVEKVLKPLWDESVPKGINVKTHLEAILNRATAKGYRAGDNPASLKGPLGLLLHDARRIHTVESRAALPYQEIGEFMVRLRAWRNRKGGISGIAKLLEFIILTAVRVSQAQYMRWEEIDWDKRLWTCPWQRTKTGRRTNSNHLVPLSDAALALVREQQDLRIKGDLVFASLDDRMARSGKLHRVGEAFGADAPKQFLRAQLKRPDITVHGFRTSFSSWANDNNFQREAIEMALDHSVGNNVERIYARDSKRLEQRRQLMEAWAQFCARTEPLPAEVVPFRQAK